jgi:hypothetical protein
VTARAHHDLAAASGGKEPAPHWGVGAGGGGGGGGGMHACVGVGLCRGSACRGCAEAFGRRLAAVQTLRSLKPQAGGGWRAALRAGSQACRPACRQRAVHYSFFKCAAARGGT